MIIYRCFPRRIKRDLYVMADQSKDGPAELNTMEPLFIATGDPSTWPAKAAAILSPRHPNLVAAPICTSTPERFDVPFIHPDLLKDMIKEN